MPNLTSLLIACVALGSVLWPAQNGFAFDAAAQQDGPLIQGGDPTSWDAWTTGDLTLERSDQNNHPKSITVKFRVSKSAAADLLTVSTSDWAIDLSGKLASLPNPVLGRIKLKAELSDRGTFDEVVIRIPSRGKMFTPGIYQCTAIEIALEEGRIFDTHAFPLRPEDCEQ